MITPISLTVEKYNSLMLLAWNGGQSPYQVWARDSLNAADIWYKIGSETNNSYIIFPIVGNMQFFKVESVNVAPYLGQPNHFMLSRDGISIDIDIENPQNVMFYPNAGYRFLYARNCPGLLGVNVTSNRLQVMDFDGSTNILQLRFGNNNMKQMPIGYDKMDKLLSLECGNNLLTEISFKNKSKLMSVTCEENQITVFDTSENVSLNNFKPYSNPFVTLDFSKNINLQHIDTGDTPTYSNEAFSNNLIQLDSLGIKNGTWECYGSYPNAAGLIAQKSLETKGWGFLYLTH